jgi:organic hydroperoxide reductase OsmC/OhrA
MKATVSWQNNMVFIGRSASGFPVQMDADLSFGGMESGVRPMEMIALGLAGCTAMDVISILRKKRQDVTQFSQGRLSLTSSLAGVFLKTRSYVRLNWLQPNIAPHRSCLSQRFRWIYIMKFTKTKKMEVNG